MASKQKTAPHEAESPKPLKVGSRVCCTDDGVEGHITWANATAVKIRWDDGEQVTWRRDSLVDRPLKILDPPDDASVPQPEGETQAPALQPATEPAATASLAVAPTPPTQLAALEPPAVEPAPQLGESVPAPAPEPKAEPAPADQQAGETSVGGEATQEAEQAEDAKPAQQTNQRKEPKAQPKQLSALDAAAQVLAQASVPMSCQELIAAMAAQGLWSSPAGKTPPATLYSALLREIQTKGDRARFVKADRGKFALRTAHVQP